MCKLRDTFERFMAQNLGRKLNGNMSKCSTNRLLYKKLDRFWSVLPDFGQKWSKMAQNDGNVQNWPKIV